MSLTRQQVIEQYLPAYQGNQHIKELPECEIDCKVCEYPRLRSVVDSVKGTWFRLNFWRARFCKIYWAHKYVYVGYKPAHYWMKPRCGIVFWYNKFSMYWNDHRFSIGIPR